MYKINVFACEFDVVRACFQKSKFCQKYQVFACEFAKNTKSANLSKIPEKSAKSANFGHFRKTRKIGHFFSINFSNLHSSADFLTHKIWSFFSTFSGFCAGRKSETPKNQIYTARLKTSPYASCTCFKKVPIARQGGERACDFQPFIPSSSL